MYKKRKKTVFFPSTAWRECIKTISKGNKYIYLCRRNFSAISNGKLKSAETDFRTSYNFYIYTMGTVSDLNRSAPHLEWPKKYIYPNVDKNKRTVFHLKH